MRKFYLCILIVSLFTSCLRLQGPYRTEYPDIPDDWKPRERGASQADKNFQACLKDFDHWWEVFDDEALNALETAAINNNYNLEAALDRISQAKAKTLASYGAIFPQLAFNPNEQGSGTLSIFGDRFGATGQTSIPRFTLHQYNVPLQLNYEVDVWGRLYQGYLSNYYLSQAAEQDYLNIWLQLTTDVATNYFQIRGLDAQEIVLKKNIQSRQESLDITNFRYKAGLIFYTDVSRAQVDLSVAIAELKDVQRQRVLQEDILALLLGEAASNFHVAFNPLPLDTDPVEVPTGIPSELLTRRPDITLAERRMAANYASLGVAYTAFFPAITFTGGLALFSPSSALLGKWASRYWNFGIGALQSVFDGGQNYANLVEAKAILKESMALYEQQILIAFRDVEDSLGNIYYYGNISKDLKEAVDASELTLDLSRIRYLQGLSSYLDVTTAERDVLTAQRSFVNNQTQRYLSSVLLIKALGGGWSCPYDTSHYDLTLTDD